jgi:phage shock protein C
VNAQFRDADRRLRDLEFHLTSESRELANEIEKLR